MTSSQRADSPALGRAPVAVIGSAYPDPGLRLPPRPRADRQSARGALLLGLLGVVLLVGGAGLWSVTARITGAVIAHGQVEVERHHQIIQHPGGGVVESVPIRDGQQVEAGELLIRLDGTALRSELAIVESQYFELLARRGRLEAERADQPAPEFPAELTRMARLHPDIAALMQGQARLFSTRLDTLEQAGHQWDQQALQVRNQIDGIDAQAKALHSQRALVGRELADQRSLLDRGLTQAARVMALEREEARLAGLSGEMQSRRAQGETRLTEIGIARLKAAAEHREAAEAELRNLAPRELELAERRHALADQIARLDIRAPLPGIVHQLQVTSPRAVLRAAEPALYLIPRDRPLLVTARIPPRDIDEISVGQPVVLRLAALSGRAAETIHGRLERISGDTVTDATTGQQFYRAEVTVLPPDPGRPNQPTLIPGMPVELYFQTGERSPLAYLLGPLSDYFTRAFREG